MGHVVPVGKLKLGAGQPLFVIAGPCVIENERHPVMMAAVDHGQHVNTCSEGREGAREVLIHKKHQSWLRIPLRILQLSFEIIGRRKG